MAGIALAGPRHGDRDARVRREGIAVMMAVDISGSMRALDLSENNREPRTSPNCSPIISWPCRSIRSARHWPSPKNRSSIPSSQFRCCPASLPSLRVTPLFNQRSYGRLRPTAACCTPGIRRIAAVLSSNSFLNAAESWKRASSRDALAVITPVESNPDGKVCRWTRVRMRRPEAASNTTVSATSLTINVWRKRNWSPPVAARLETAERKSNRRAVRAGSMPNSTLVTRDMRTVNVSTRPSRPT